LRRLLTRLPAPSPVARCQRGRSPLAENQIALIPLSRLLACAVLASTMLASACGAKAAPAVQPQSPPLDPTQQLAARIAGMLADPAFEHATWAISIRSLDRHDTLYAVNPHKLVMPASTMKLVTLAAAARQLGWDYAYETTLLATGPVASGALAGDLVIVGSGDPSIDDWDGSASRLFAEWAARLKSAGISHIDGRLIGDDNAFSDTPLGSGWAWDDLSASYATSIGGLQFNENTAQLVITPALRPGQPARIELAPPSAPVSVRNGVGTSSPDVPQALTIRPAPRGPDIDVHGSIPLNAPPQIRNVSVPNPTRYFANALRLALAINGVDIRGETLDVDDLAAPPNAAAARPLVSHRSAPLSTLAATMMKMSQNLYAETLLRTLGASAAHDGSPEGGRAAVLRTLADWGIPATEIVMAWRAWMAPWPSG
jgi:D-alanyl-D-alanine carboxypeptidase/D-alanyl-D-alanine-endopeptidase (penicillin-binding protein 4)